jgi:uncharacterized protein YegP (UPF0339 family)
MKKEFYVVRQSAEWGKEIVKDPKGNPRIYRTKANAENAIAQFKNRQKRNTRWMTPENAASVYKNWTPVRVYIYGDSNIHSKEL